MTERKTAREWTIEQEIALFKAICRFKPAGRHKHFRMLAIYQMVNNSNINSSSPLTTRDIWEKLRTLYNLEGLDELEDQSIFLAEEESAKPPKYFGSLGGKLSTDGTYIKDFELDWDEFGVLIQERALAEEEEASDNDGEEEEENTNASVADNEEEVSESEQEIEETEDEEVAVPMKRSRSAPRKPPVRVKRNTRQKSAKQSEPEPSEPEPEPSDKEETPKPAKKTQKKAKPPPRRSTRRKA